ncbi:MAG TPA: DUF418 domain-containing protein [Chitinophagaceae bacterium]
MSNIFNTPGAGTEQPITPHHIAAPGQPSLFSLDVLRGIGLLGLLFVSSWEFGGLSTSQQNLFYYGTHGGNYKLFTIVSVLFEGKMLALLSLVFGAGIIAFMQKKHPTTLATHDAYIRRQLWLMAFGVFNAFILVWPSDILFPFGVLGVLLFGFWRLKTRGLLIAALVCTLIYTGKQYWNYADDKKDYKKFLAVKDVEKKFKQDSTTRAKKDSTDRIKDTVLLKDVLVKNKIADSLAKKNDTLTKKQAEEKGKWKGMIKAMKYDSAQVKAENKAMRSKKYTDVSYHAMSRSQDKESFWLYRKGIWEIAALMFLGMALYTIGFFNKRYAASRYIGIGVLLIIAGLAFSWYRISFNNARLPDYTTYIDKHALPYDQWQIVENMTMALGYASLVIGLLHTRLLHWLWMAMAATGKLALTNYTMQTIICSFFFYGYGFGYFGRMSQWQLYFMMLEIIMVQVIFSVLWLRYYAQGPLEWLWGCLIYRKWLPNKKIITTHQAS